MIRIKCVIILCRFMCGKLDWPSVCHELSLICFFRSGLYFRNFQLRLRTFISLNITSMASAQIAQSVFLGSPQITPEKLFHGGIFTQLQVIRVATEAFGRDFIQLMLYNDAKSTRIYVKNTPNSLFWKSALFRVLYITAYFAPEIHFIVVSAIWWKLYLPSILKTIEQWKRCKMVETAIA